MGRANTKEVEISSVIKQKEDELEQLKAAKRTRQRQTIQNIDTLCELITITSKRHDSSEEEQVEAIPEPSPLVS